MDNTKDDNYYVGKIKKDIEFLIKHTKSLTNKEMQSDEVLLDSIMFRLVQISENSAKLTDKFKQQHSEISWFAIRGLRNRIVHDYGNVDYSIIYETVKKDILNLYDMLKNI